jgi:putative hydrolase of HD superfamily
MMVIVLAEYADEPIDVGHTVELVLVHDLIEIYAGDTPLYDTAAAVGQLERERAAADRLFALLPADQGARLRASWDEFELRVTPEARFAKAVDRLQPQVLNWLTDGGTWRSFAVSLEDVRSRKSAIGEASDTLEAVSEALLEAAADRGWIRR